MEDISLNVGSAHPGPPTWLPDYSALGFFGDDNSIFVVDPTCSAATTSSCLDLATAYHTGIDNIEGYLSWSSVDQAIALVRFPPPPDHRSLVIYHPQSLPRTFTPFEGHGRLDWSRDGKFLLTDSIEYMAIGGLENAQSKIFSLEDNSLRNLIPGTSDLPNSASAKWSPDGTRVVFMATFGTGFAAGATYDIYVAQADGSDPQLVAKNGMDADWSPDGDLIVFEREDGLYVMKLADLMPIKVVSLDVVHPAPHPSWSP